MQDYVFVNGIAKESVERRLADDMGLTGEVCVYAKLPRGFCTPTHMGNYSLNWAITFNKWTIKHIYFIVETKGTMESLFLSPIEQTKINCARKLHSDIFSADVVYHSADSYQRLLKTSWRSYDVG